ncbi:PTS sugar transporter subunit IIA [Terrilactibacillus tamarindi]|uniref:PTS sugar transporter subunit IIA n=1 Tax=Terrilactibacillus tamarindi TaxID=2599694 RepID=UPI001E4621CE|nr:PTS sugar transporter subunit IIA [Terrilactibacillus tamarindi]
MIKQEHVVIRESVRDWREAIYEASKPLLADLSITNSYITAMQAEYPVLSPNIILRSNVAIPHVAPEHGVNQVSMSLLKLKKGLEVDQKIRIHFVVVIAAIDKLQHLDALRELMELASNESILSKMLETDDTRKLFQLIQV